MVLDHFGTPVGVGRYADQREAIFDAWKRDIADIARCENVVAKIGGLAMPDNGFGWNVAERPPTSDEFIDAQGRYYRHMIECFGADRCMFESNFPVDRLSLSYRTVWNAFKKLVADFSTDERDAMLRGTAARIYRLS
jgi:predicted TIM-barrel fold metal-dependent hydrolase